MEQSDASGFTDAAPPRLDESTTPVRRPRKAAAKAATASAPAEPAPARTPQPKTTLPKKTRGQATPPTATEAPEATPAEAPTEPATPNQTAKKSQAAKKSPAKKAPAKKAVPASPTKSTATVSTAAPKPAGNAAARQPKPQPASQPPTPAEPKRPAAQAAFKPEPKPAPASPATSESITEAGPEPAAESRPKPTPEPPAAARPEATPEPESTPPFEATPPVPQRTLVPPTAAGRRPARPEAARPVRKGKPDPRVRLMERAVSDLAPPAEEWLERTRRRYPQAGPDALARLAAWDYARMARRRAVASGAANLVGPFAATAPLTRLRVEVVLAVAAIHGRHTKHLPRDLVTLLRLRSPKTALTPIAGLAVRVLAARVIPFGGAAVAAVQARAIEDVAGRAHSYYKGLQPGNVTV